MVFEDSIAGLQAAKAAGKRRFSTFVPQALEEVEREEEAGERGEAGGGGRRVCGARSWRRGAAHVSHGLPVLPAFCRDCLPFTSRWMVRTQGAFFAMERNVYLRSIVFENHCL